MLYIWQVLNMSARTGCYFGTKYAMIKVVDGMEFVVAKRQRRQQSWEDEDEVLTVCPLEENDTLVMATKKDMFLRIDCAQIPQKKKKVRLACVA